MNAATGENRSIPWNGIGVALGVACFLVLLYLPNDNPESSASDPGLLRPSAQRLAAVTVLMGTLWLTQAIPIAATSLLPLLAFPLLGIQSSKAVSKAYINENIFLFLGGFIIALGIEKWGLHRRMALCIVWVLGSSVKRVVLGFMLATAFLSMWISNTASTLLMMPIGLALLVSFRDLANEDSDGDTGDDENHAGEPTGRATDSLAVVLMLGIAYSASIGGAATLVGTPTNVAFQGIWQEQYPQAPELSAGTWMAVWVPPAAVFLLCVWGLLVARLPAIPGAERMTRGFFHEKLRALGSPSRAEWMMLGIFVTTALLWVFRTPLRFGTRPVLPGWGEFVARGLSGWGVKAEMLHDSTVAIGMALLMFCLPAARDESGRRLRLMDWKTAEKLPWGILLLIGGGFAIAGGFRETGLSTWLGQWFAAQAEGAPLWLLVAGACLLMTFLTEFTSNVATVSALLPVLAGAAFEIGIDPRLIMIPATVATSCAFMLPIATPPNAIVFGTGRIRMGQMARYGIVLNLLGVVVLTLATFLLLVPQLGITPAEPPAWATETVRPE